MEDIKSILTNRGYIINKKKFNTKLITKIKQELSVEPYSINKNFNNNIIFKLYLENKNQLCIPKYYGIKNIGVPEIDDIEDGLSIKVKFVGSMRDYQNKILNILIPKFLNEKGGLLCVPPGKGKTAMGLNILTKLKKKTIIIVHKSFLLNQWKERIAQFVPDAKVGIIQQNKIEIDDTDIVIGMLQSISIKNYDLSIFEDFGLTIIDEVHHLGAQVFSNLFKKVNTKYMLGLSATPYREDKLEKVINWHIGDILYYESSKVNQNQNIQVLLCHYTSNDKLFKIVMNNRTQTAQISTMITNITNIHNRTKTIINLILQIKQKENKRKFLVLSDRIEHLERMKHLVNENSNYSTSLYIGGMKEKKLKEAELAEIIFSTYQMSSEGLDIPTLNTIVLTTSRKNIEQSVGRILRKQDGYDVEPLIIDIVDNLKQFKNQSNIRKRHYKKITNENNINNYKNIDYNFIKIN